MAISVVGNVEFTGTGSSFSQALGRTPAVGELITVMAQTHPASNACGAPSLTGVASWTLDETIDTNRKLRIWRGVVTTSAGSSITINPTSGSFTGNCTGNVQMSTGLLASAGFKSGSSGTNSGTGTAISTGSVTPPAYVDSIMFATLYGGGGPLSAPDASWTLLTNSNSSMYLAYKLVSANASPSADSFSCTQTSAVWVATISCYALGRLSVSVQPSNLSTGSNFSPVVKCQAWTNGTSIDTSFGSAITVAVNSGGGTLSGTLNPSAVSGEATYTGVGMSAGSGSQTLVFSASGYTPVVSNSFTLSAPSSNLLAITQQPTTIYDGDTFSPVVTVEVRTNGVSVDASSTLAVTATVTTGSGALIGTVTRNAVAGVATFTGLGISGGTGTHVITFSGTSYTSIASNNVTVNATTFTLAITTQPECALSGAATSAVVQVKRNGVLLSSFTGNITAAKQTGTWSTSGSTLTVACVGGVATFGNLRGTGSGKGTWRFTDATHSVTVDSGDFYVEQTPYATTAGYTPIATLRDSEQNLRQWYSLFVPNGASSGTPLPLVWYIPGSGHYGSNYASMDAAVADYQSSGAGTFSGYVDGNKSTFPAFVLSMPVPLNDDYQKRSNRIAFLEVVDHLVAIGYNIDLTKLSIYGYSTGYIEISDHMFISAHRLAAVVMNDGSVTGRHLTANGLGSPPGTLNASYDSLTYDDYAMFASLLGPTWAAKGCAMAVFSSNTTSVVGVRDIAIPDPWLDEMDAHLAVPFNRVNSSGTTYTLNPAVRYEYRNFTATDHGGIESQTMSASNRAGLLAWLFAQQRTTDTDITLVKLAPPLTGHAMRAAQADTRANVTKLADTRPQFRFIR